MAVECILQAPRKGGENAHGTVRGSPREYVLVRFRASASVEVHAVHDVSNRGCRVGRWRGGAGSVRAHPHRPQARLRRGCAMPLRATLDPGAPAGPPSGERGQAVGLPRASPAPPHHLTHGHGRDLEPGRADSPDRRRPRHGHGPGPSANHHGSGHRTAQDHARIRRRSQPGAALFPGVERRAGSPVVRPERRPSRRLSGRRRHAEHQLHPPVRGPVGGPDAARNRSGRRVLAVVMELKKLTAGDGYTYLVKHVATVTTRPGTSTCNQVRTWPGTTRPEVTRRGCGSGAAPPTSGSAGSR